MFGGLPALCVIERYKHTESFLDLQYKGGGFLSKIKINPMDIIEELRTLQRENEELYSRYVKSLQIRVICVVSLL